MAIPAELTCMTHALLYSLGLMLKRSPPDTLTIAAKKPADWTHPQEWSLHPSVAELCVTAKLYTTGDRRGMTS